MTNWCFNELIVIGQSEYVKRFVKDNPEIDFGEYRRYPLRFKLKDILSKVVEDVSNLLGTSWSVNDGFNSGGYEWCLDNWGTKWNAYTVDSDIDEEYREAIYRFKTSYSPPSQIIELMKEEYPNLTFTLYFDEPNMDARGVFKR